jgi:hypothetical protein
MKKIILLMFVFVLAMSLVASRIVNDDQDSGDTTNAGGAANVMHVSNAGGVANMTFGRCVSEAAKLRNDCYKSAVTQAKTCITGAAKDKNASKQCKQTAKDGANQCKNIFKDTKKTQCGQIKARFLERLIYDGM